MTRKIPALGLGGLLLAALLAFWPATPDLGELPAPAPSSRPLERPDRPPHPASIYTPGR